MKFFSKEKNVSTAHIAFWYLVSNILVKGLSVISTPIFTRLMSKSEYGEFANFTSWESLLFIIISLQLHATVPRAKYDFKGRIDQYLCSITVLSNAVALCLYIIVETNKSFFEIFLGMDIIYIRVLFLYLFFAPSFSFLQIKHRIFGKYKSFVLFSISSAFIRVLVSVILVILMQNKFLGRLIGYVVPMVILYFVIWSYTLIRGRKPSIECMKYAFVIAIPLIFNALAGNVLSTSDRIMIKQMVGAEETATYTVPYTASTILNLIWTSLNQAWTPWLYDRMHEGNLKIINDSSKWYFGVYAIFIIPVLLITPEIVLILAGSAYYEARYIMPPIIVGCVFQFIYGMYVNIETFEKKTWLIVIGTLGAAVTNIILNLIFIPKCGYFAAAYTTLVGYLFLMLFHFLSVRKLGKYNGIYNMKFIGSVVFGVFLLHFICMFLYRYIFVRYIILILYLIVLLVIVMKTEVIKKINYKKRR